MAIKRFELQPSTRKLIACIGGSPTFDAENYLIQSGYQLQELKPEQLFDDTILAGLDSVIFVQGEDKPGLICDAISDHAAMLLNWDVRIYVLPAGDAGRGKAARKYILNRVLHDELPFIANLSKDEPGYQAAQNSVQQEHQHSPYLYIADVKFPWLSAAKLIVSNPSGKPPSSILEIEGKKSSGKDLLFEPDQKLLLRRAFEDCLSIKLISFEDGLSGATAFRAYSTLRDGVLGQHPTVSFVKIGPRDKISREYFKYLGNALEYIPFCVGPNLRLDRCALGARQGILVGDLIEGAESLRDCATAGRAAAAIGNLFSHTLKNWRSLSKLSEQNIFTMLEPYLGNDIPKERLSLAEGLGSTMSRDDFRSRMEKLSTSPVQIGPIHGDLHATNVLVRGSDAVLIDFERMENDKLCLYDSASLEGGLFVDGFIDDKRDVASVLKSVSPLYEKGALTGVLPNCHPMDPSAWFYDCVRQIRTHAAHVECCPGQYGLTLAAAFSKKAANTKIFNDKRDELRAAGYVIAERIISSLERKAE